ncbi:hypothetical protein BDZ97DRAFT_1846942 [Flammula alnicola]|nr:hypothetical protein BDZ97DRAFT_1846942 [Flammula alnicola]
MVSFLFLLISSLNRSTVVAHAQNSAKQKDMVVGSVQVKGLSGCFSRIHVDGDLCKWHLQLANTARRNFWR